MLLSCSLSRFFFQYVGKLVFVRVSGHVELYRRDCSIAVFEGPCVAVGVVRVVWSIVACNPVVSATSRVFTLLLFFMPFAQSHFAYLDAFDSLHVRYVYVEAYACRQSFSEHLLHDGAYTVFHIAEVGIVFYLAAGKCYGRHSLYASLQGNRHGARVVGVDSAVVAVVDASEHKVGTLGQQHLKGHFRAVVRSAGA